MPTWWQLTPAEEDEDYDLPQIDPPETVKDPAHPWWEEEFELGGGPPGEVLSVFAALPEERNYGYMITAPWYPEEASEDTRDWGIFTFHASRAYDLWED